MDRTVPELRAAGKTRFRLLELTASTSERLLCARHQGSLERRLEGRPVLEGHSEPGEAKQLSGCGLPSLCPTPAVASGDLPPSDPRISTLH